MNKLKIGAIFGLIAKILSIFSSIFILYYYLKIIIYEEEVSNIFSNQLFFIFLNIIIYFGILFYYIAFLEIGKRYKNNLLKVVSWIFIVSYIIIIFLMFISLITSSISLASAQNNINIDNEPYLIMLSFIILILLFIVFVIASILSILFGVGIKNLKEVKYSKITGILYIIGGATMIFIIGFILNTIAFFFSIALLFNESKKRNKKNIRSKR
ncbi:MAG: hypothetical protein QW117_00725 [Candidatus Pacearchaeota archaeon]